ncbi:hypothetical protein AAMO2058_001130000 [Amorphochlora amoebiformis]|uniref:ADP,ATP carrier protein n=1 Tax=Amorphochlora amoebiformis TaxID=1561963 RepID=A0A7S0CSE3_9EUKA|mmetsp:Transcript_11792/g.18738  ORF Transcript_11792/g.18738 Transcript_11792/m.18738 type:complete len:240 (+) Transcript_11792:70-789(+)
MKKDLTVPPLAKMVAGGSAGIIAKTVVSPLERARILAQTGESSLGAVSTIVQIVREEGMSGLWRGNTVNCLRVFPAKAVLFSANDMWKSNFRWVLGRETLPTGVGFLSGSLAGMTASLSTYPLDYARTRLSGTFARNTRSSGMVSVIVSTVNAEGIAGLYKGIVPSLWGALPYEGIKFGCYDVLSSLVNTRGTDETSLFSKFTCGAISGTVAGFVMYPNDTVRKLLQMQDRSNMKYKRY